MAINPAEEYEGKVVAPSAEYPYGSAQNITVTGDGTGTPWEAALINDMFGFQQALLSESEIVPTGTSENATASQYLDAIKLLSKKSTGALSTLAASSVGGMLLGQTIGGESVEIEVGQVWSSGATLWVVVSVSATVALSDFEPLGTIFAQDFHAFDGSDATVEMLLLASASAGADVVFPMGGGFIVTAEVNFPTPKSIDFGNTSVSYSSGNTTNPITVGQNIVVEKSTLTSTLDKLSVSLTLDDISNVEVGSMLSLYDPTDYSWSGWRPDYRKGEYLFVSDISGNTVTFRGATIDTYDSGSKVYLFTTLKCKLTGKLTVTNTGTYGTTFGLRCWGLVDSDLTGLKVRLNDGTHALSLAKSVSCTGSSMEAIQSSGQVNQREYGLAQANCMNNTFEGRFHAERHGSTVGGDGQAGSAINRFLTIRGIITTTGLGSIQAADFHGNSEFCKYGGYIDGVTSGGSDTIIEEGSYIFSPVDGLAPLTYSELKNTRHSAKNVTVVCNGIPSNRGIIDAGGGSDVITADTVEGGAFDFTGSHLVGADAPLGVTIQNNGATGILYDIILNDVTVDAPSMATLLACVPDAGVNVNKVQFNNDIWQIGVSATSSNIDGMKYKGEEVILLDTGLSEVTANVALPTAFPSNRFPAVKTSLSLGVVGGVGIGVTTSSSSEGSFDIRLYRVDGTNFSAAINITVRWVAEAMPR